MYIRGRQVFGLDARFGQSSSPTRNGSWRIFRKVKNDYSAMYHSPMPYSLYFSGGQALHFSKYFRADGYWGASHGCINMRDYTNVVRLWKATPLGTPTYIYN
jgi:lipoprotein-anchoring transpeptidase ErfK/SrfK